MADAWRAEMGQTFDGLAAELLEMDGTPQLAGRLRATHLGQTGAFAVQGTPQLVRRTSRTIANASASPLKLCLQQSGRATVHQGQSEVLLNPGQLAIYDTGQPYDIRLEGPWRCAVMTLPRETLDIRQPDLERALNTVIMLGAAQQREILGWWKAAAGPRLANPAEAESLGMAGVRLVASMVFNCKIKSDATGALRDRVRLHITSRLHDPALNHATVASALGLSVRTLHRLFEDEPQSVAALIRSSRLEAIRTALLDPANRTKDIMSIAARCGYLDQPHFTRAFKAQFGLTPALLRREHRDRIVEAATDTVGHPDPNPKRDPASLS
jgi:AraC-like DNA-binding protein